MFDLSFLQKGDGNVVGEQKWVELIGRRESLEVLWLEKEGDRLGHLAAAHGDGCGGGALAHDIAGDKGLACERGGGQGSGVDKAVHDAS